MYKRISGTSKLIFSLLIICSLMFSGACYNKKIHVSEKKALMPRIGVLVFVGFQAAIPLGEKGKIVRDSLSGAIFMAEPVAPDIVQKMTDILFDRLVTIKRYELVSPGQAKGAFSNIVDSDKNVGMEPAAILQKVGKTFGADAVLTGCLYRWRERVGTDYAVDRPASVAYDLHLIRPADGAIIWRAKFDKTQASLSENFLDLATFIQSGGRWMTVEHLAMIGLKNILKDMPAGLKKSGDL